MRYRATFKENLGFYGLFGLFGLSMAWIGLRTHQLLFAAVGLLLLSFLLLVRFRLYVSCGEKTLETRNLFRTSTVRWDQIHQVKRAADCGFWASCFCGPFTSAFKTSSGSVRINFKFYSPECSREVMRHVSSRLPALALNPGPQRKAQ